MIIAICTKSFNIVSNIRIINAVMKIPKPAERNYMKTIDDIQRELKSLASELEQLKESKNDSVPDIDFAKISAHGMRFPIKNHPMKNCDKHQQKCYLTLLLSIVNFDKDVMVDTITFIHRIAYGMGYLKEGKDLSEEYLAAQALTFAQLDEMTKLFLKSDMRFMFIEECLILSGAFKKGRSKAFEYISELADMLVIKTDEMKVIANIAAVIVSRDPKKYKLKQQNPYDFMECYLKEISFDRKVFTIGDVFKEFFKIPFDEQITGYNSIYKKTYTNSGKITECKYQYTNVFAIRPVFSNGERLDFGNTRHYLKDGKVVINMVSRYRGDSSCSNFDYEYDFCTGFRQDDCNCPIDKKPCLPSFDKCMIKRKKNYCIVSPAIKMTDDSTYIFIDKYDIQLGIKRNTTDEQVLQNFYDFPIGLTTSFCDLPSLAEEYFKKETKKTIDKYLNRDSSNSDLYI